MTNEELKSLRGTELYYRKSQQGMTVVLLTEKEESELFKQYHGEGNLDARNRILENHLLFAAIEGLKVARGRWPDDEVISAANVGMMNAIVPGKFIPGRGYRFSAYCRLFIRGEVLALWKENVPLKIPSGWRYTEMSLNASPNPNPHYKEHGVPKQLLNCPELQVTDSYVEKQTGKDRIIALLEGLNTLTAKERFMVQKYYIDKHSLASVGKMMRPRVQREAIRQLHFRVLRKLKAFLSKKEIFTI